MEDLFRSKGETVDLLYSQDNKNSRKYKVLSITAVQGVILLAKGFHLEPFFLQVC